MKCLVRRMSCLAAMVCFAWIARAGVIIQNEGTELGGSQQKQKTTLYIQSGKMRMEADSPTAGKSVVIFDGDKQVVWMLNPESGTYREMNGQQMDQMAQQMNGAMQQMQARMGSLPPEQRKMVEEMMKRQMGGGGAAPEVTVQEKGSEKVASYDTTHYAVLSNGQLTQEVWAASPDQVHLDESDFKTFRDMAKFWEPLTRNAPKGSWSVTAMQQIKGLPVKTVTYEGQRPNYEWDVVKVEHKSLDDSLFTVPAGMKKQEMMPPGMGMGQGQGMGR